MALLVATLSPALCGAQESLVRFPQGFEKGIRYAIINRGDTREEIFTSSEAILAAQNGKKLPSGTVITLADYRGGKLFRYVVMEKRRGWGTGRPASQRNGEWEYQAFNADKSVNTQETLERCFTCHKSVETKDFVFTADQLTSKMLKD